MKELYIEKYKILMKGIEEDTKNGKSPYVHGLEESIFLSCPCYPKQSIDSMHATPIKTPMTFFIQLEKTILKYIWNNKNKTLQMAKAI